MNNNYFTLPDRRPTALKDRGEIEDILKKYETQLPYQSTADICGTHIQLKTNSKHVYDFWKLNWFESSSEKVDGEVIAIKNVENYEPTIFYNLDERKVLILNCEYYGAVKSKGALGLTSKIFEEKNVLSIHGASLGFEKNGKVYGLVIIAPTGTGKTTLFYQTLYHSPNTFVIGDDYLFAFFENEVICRQPENWLYMRSEIARENKLFLALFKSLPQENVVESKENCRQKDVENSCYSKVSRGEEKCIFDLGHNKCFWSYGNSRVMFPREKFPMLIKDENNELREVSKGKERVKEEFILKYVVILTRDRETRPHQKLDKEKALEILKEGKFVKGPGSGPPEEWGKIGYEPLHNPYLIEPNIKKQLEMFGELFERGVVFYLLNTGWYENKKIEVHQTFAYLNAILHNSI